MIPIGHPVVRQTDRQQGSTSVERYCLGYGPHYVKKKCRVIGSVRVFLSFFRANLCLHVEEDRDTHSEHHT
jgi:hypothetical protein